MLDAKTLWDHPKIEDVSCIKPGGGRQSVDNRQKFIKISWKLTKTLEKTKKIYWNLAETLAISLQIVLYYKIAYNIHQQKRTI